MRETIKQFKRNLIKWRILDYRIIEYTIFRSGVIITKINIRESISKLKLKMRSGQLLDTDIIQYRILPTKFLSGKCLKKHNNTSVGKRIGSLNSGTPRASKNSDDDGYGTRPGNGIKNSRILKKKN